MTRPTIVRRKYIPRMHIGEALEANGGWMNAREICAALSETRRTRQLLNGAASISTMLRGAEGIDCRPYSSSSPAQYKMVSMKVYQLWCAGPDWTPEKWHGKI